MNELHLFAGAGGGILAGMLLGHRCIGAVEIEPYAQQVLLARQRDGILPPFPIFSDIRNFDGRPFAGRVGIVAGGFPCQDISVAGSKSLGLEGARSGLWREMARIVREVRPRFVYVENSPRLTALGLGTVLGDLAALGYDADWGVVSAADTGAPHLRERIWIVAHAHGVRELQPPRRERNKRARPGHGGAALSDSHGGQQAQQRIAGGMGGQQRARSDAPVGAAGGVVWPAEPGLGRMAHGVAHRVDRLKALGNGQVPRVAATAWRLLTEAA